MHLSQIKYKYTYVSNIMYFINFQNINSRHEIIGSNLMQVPTKVLFYHKYGYLYI